MSLSITLRYYKLHIPFIRLNFKGVKTKNYFFPDFPLVGAQEEGHGSSIGKLHFLCTCEL